ncbi:hypothetical protein ScFU53_08620 [Streptococcus canis]|nr:hypothetical protein ScFU53_08620 [Streptococcus canis]GFG44990.1 hypothetical protein ScFU93_02360 [Streptococcus canis]
MQDYYTPKSKQLTLTRRMIDRWLKEEQSNREIARRLAKAPQTIHNEVKRGQVRQQVRQGKYEQVYSADFAQKAYQNNRKRSVKQVTLTKELKEKIVHYIKQKYSSEMMVKTKGVNIPISTIYYWIHHGHLGLTKADRLYPRKNVASKNMPVPTLSRLESLLRSDLKALTIVSIAVILKLIRLFKLGKKRVSTDADRQKKPLPNHSTYS